MNLLFAIVGTGGEARGWEGLQERDTLFKQKVREASWSDLNSDAPHRLRPSPDFLSPCAGRERRTLTSAPSSRAGPPRPRLSPGRCRERGLRHPRAPAAGTVPRARATRRRRSDPGARRMLPRSCRLEPEARTAQTPEQGCEPRAEGSSPGATSKHADDSRQRRTQSSRGRLLLPGPHLARRRLGWATDTGQSAQGAAGLGVIFTEIPLVLGDKWQRVPAWAKWSARSAGARWLKGEGAIMQHLLCAMAFAPSPRASFVGSKPVRLRGWGWGWGAERKWRGGALVKDGGSCWSGNRAQCVFTGFGLLMVRPVLGRVLSLNLANKAAGNAPDPTLRNCHGLSWNTCVLLRAVLSVLHGWPH